VVRDLSTEKCPFCDDIPGISKFVGHLCHHLEEISLSAIPQNTESDDEDQENSKYSDRTKLRYAPSTYAQMTDYGSVSSYMDPDYHPDEAGPNVDEAKDATSAQPPQYSIPGLYSPDPAIPC
jgi:hypothetical protein